MPQAYLKGAMLIRSLGDKTPRIHPSCFISEACYIVGDVEIGENSSVWPGAVIRGDYGRITIGRNSAVQDKAVTHTDGRREIGDNVLLTHSVVVHGGRIGNNVFVGVNATILESAEIGNYCLIGAQTLVRAHAKIPDGSLVIGVPGRAMPLSEAQRRLVEDPTSVYVRNAQAYRAAGLGEALNPR